MYPLIIEQAVLALQSKGQIDRAVSLFQVLLMLLLNPEQVFLQRFH